MQTIRSTLLLICLILSLVASTTVPAAADPIRPTGYGGPSSIVVGPDGALWFTEAAGNKIGRMTTTGAITEFAIPTPNSGPNGITVGPDGAIWFTENGYCANKIGRLSLDGTITDTITEYGLLPSGVCDGYTPSTIQYAPSDIVAGPDGAFWFRKHNGIGRITTAGDISYVTLPAYGGSPQDLIVGPDGNLWYIALNLNGFAGPRIVEIIPNAGGITTKVFGSETNYDRSYTTMTAGPDGALWITRGYTMITRMTLDGQFRDFPLPTPPGNQPLGTITTGPDGALWFVESGINAIGRLTTDGTFSTFALPSIETGITDMMSGPDGALWFTEGGRNRIGRMTTGGRVTEYTLPTPHDQFYFPQTGYRVDSSLFWEYVTGHGGVDTFGYPVSREFWLQGFPVQIFQRQVLQLDLAYGRVRPLNLLDPDVLPIMTINGSTFPAHDPAVAMAAPKPGTPNYATAVMQHLQTYVPDTWEGQPVNFLQTYLAAAPAKTGGARPLYALEVWGFPTSRPARDPKNANFIYQRFQRGILHYDATTGVTRGILLADALKDVLLGQGPADLHHQMQDSRYYKQYCPGQPGWLCRPATLPQTDLSFAFERQ